MQKNQLERERLDAVKLELMLAQDEIVRRRNEVIFALEMIGKRLAAINAAYERLDRCKAKRSVLSKPKSKG